MWTHLAGFLAQKEVLLSVKCLVSHSQFCILFTALCYVMCLRPHLIPAEPHAILSP